VLLGTADFKILKLTPERGDARLASLGSSSRSSSSELQRHTRARSRAPAARARVATHMGVAERRRSSAAASTRDRSDASRADADGDENDPALPWRRILYERQGYPDNHTDDSFLERLVLNGRVVPRRFTRVALDATAVSQQLAVVALKASATASLLSGRLSARDALARDAAALAAGALVAIRAAQTDGAAIAAAIGASARLGALILLGIGALTPLFQTMTAAVSDDTAFATAACALVVSALTHDYAFAHFASSDASDVAKARGAGNAVSLGCSMFAASVLASRLESRAAVFADMTLSVLLFVLFPFFSRVVAARVPAPRRVALAAAAHAAAALGVAHASAGADGAARLASTPVALYVAAVLFVALACPLWLVRMMRFKRQINGPWDEAKPRAEALAARRRRAAVRRDGHGVGF
jgi:phosphatidylinositol glycan class C protein